MDPYSIQHSSVKSVGLAQETLKSVTETNQVTNKIIQLVKANSFPIIFGTSMICLGTLATYKYYTSLNKTTERFIASCEGLENAEGIQNRIDDFLTLNWHKLDLPESCNNEQNRFFLREKLKTIINEHHQTLAEKQRIATNIMNNFTDFLSTFVTRIERDLTDDQNFRQLFEIIGIAQIISIQILGKETHNRGSNPLCITIQLNNGTNIVYKPRAVRSEKLICSSQDSIFQQYNLPTYRVYDKEGQNYGYCEYLYNNEEENTFETIEELSDFYIELGKIEKIAREIGLSDLHLENIIVHNRRPYLIDTEVVGLPNQVAMFQTHLFTFEEGVLQPADSGALASSPLSKNHVWFGEQITQYLEEDVQTELVENLIDSGVTASVIHALGDDFRDFIISIANQTHQEIVNFDIADIQHVYELRNHRNRIVLADTRDLVGIIKHNPGPARTDFINAVTQGITDWGFIVDEVELEHSLEQFDRDLLNNDVPIFYHHPGNGLIYYGAHIIAYAPAIAPVEDG